ncbi:MAG: hypothetical protein II968_08235 [Selenomonadaceae bacterium]|nr:hypothetical protein [Selenomonadaceae bacterium]MBR6712831.1 hypothetical protein [Selenomonadaceae bacterium]
MRKFLTALIVMLLMSASVEAISYADSTFAIDTINQKLREWKCTPLRIQYGGDELNTPENVAYMNELAEAHGYEKKFTACMVFYSDFHSPPDDGTPSAWNHDSDYKNWSWYFGRYADGTWKLLTWGY